MDILTYKIAATPALMLISRVISKRWGEAVGGWLVALPLVSGPISFFLALEYGTHFVAKVALGAMSGSAATAVFCLVYSMIAMRCTWWLSLLGGTAVFFMTGLIIQALDLSLPGQLVLVPAIIFFSYWIFPESDFKVSFR